MGKYYRKKTFSDKYFLARFCTVELQEAHDAGQLWAKLEGYIDTWVWDLWIIVTPWQRHQDGTFIDVFWKGPGQKRRGMCLKFRADREVEGTYRDQTGRWPGKVSGLYRSSLLEHPCPLALYPWLLATSLISAGLLTARRGYPRDTWRHWCVEVMVAARSS